MTPLDAPKSPKVDQPADTQPGGAFTESYDSMADASQTQEFDKDAIDQINKMFGSADELLNNDINDSLSGEIQEEGNLENFDTEDLNAVMEGMMEEQAAGQDGTQEEGDQDSTENLNPERDSDEEREIPQEKGDGGMSDQELLDGLQGDNGAPMQPGSEDHYNGERERLDGQESPPSTPFRFFPEKERSIENPYQTLPYEPEDLFIPPVEYDA